MAGSRAGIIFVVKDRQLTGKQSLLSFQYVDEKGPKRRDAGWDLACSAFSLSLYILLFVFPFAL